MVNFGPLTADISSGVWGTPANVNWFRVLAALLRGTLCGVEQRAPPIFGMADITLGISSHSGLWPPYVIGRAIYIFILSFVMMAIWNGADHYIFILWFLSIIFLSFFLA